VSESPDRYDCAETFRRLDDYLDRALAPDEIEKVEEHLARCERCAPEFAFDATVLREVRAKLARVQAPPSLLDSIRKRLAEDEPRSS